MPIKDLTNRVVPIQSDVRGKPIRLGYLQKGRREGFGRNIKLFDEKHFIFSPIDNGKQGELMTEIFKQVYGPTPFEIPDVRIPAGLAGNFKIEDCAWLVARKHSEKGSIFLALSDGENIKQYRSPDNGRASFHYDGEMSHEEYSLYDDRGAECLKYKGKLYPWQQEMQIDLVLPDFNRVLHKERIAGHGVVTLITHSTYDISNLLSEYYAAINEIASLIANPMSPGDFDRAKNYLPLRNFPFRLYRSEDDITTPDYRKDKDGRLANPGDRLLSTRSLVHWQLSPEFSAAAQDAMDKRTQMTLAAVANMPLLQSGQYAADKANSALYGDPEPEPPVALPAQAGPVWEDFTADLPGDVTEDEATEAGPEAVEGEFSEQPATDPPPKATENGNGTDQNLEPYQWEQQAIIANDLDEWSYRAYQTVEGKQAFAKAEACKLWYKHVIGDFDALKNSVAVETMKRYANWLADGTKKETAVKKAKEQFVKLAKEKQAEIGF